MLHLSQATQIYTHSIHPTHELILCIQITTGRVHFNGDSAVKSPFRHWVLNLCHSNPDLLRFAAVPSSQDLSKLMKSLITKRRRKKQTRWSFFGSDATPAKIPTTIKILFLFENCRSERNKNPKTLKMYRRCFFMKSTWFLSLNVLFYVVLAHAEQNHRSTAGKNFYFAPVGTKKNFQF